MEKSKIRECDREEICFVLLPQCVSPFLLQVVCHLVHLLFLLSSDGHHSGLVLLFLGLDLLLQTQTGAPVIVFPRPAVFASLDLLVYPVLLNGCKR